MKPLVVHVCSDTNIGGAGRYVLTLLNQPALRNRFDLAVACPEGKLSDALRRQGTEVIAYPGADRSFSFPAAQALFRVFRRRRPCIVHTHGALAGRLAGWAAGARVIYTKHGLAAVSEQSIQVRTRGLGALLKRLSVSMMADRIVAVSRAVTHSLIAAGAAPDRLRVIPGGVETESFAQIDPGPPSVIGTLGRLSHEKGFDILLQAMKHLDDSVRLVIGGEGPQRQALAEQARSLGLWPDRVEFAGFVADVPTFLSEITLFVLPSRSEGLGLVIVEAMAAGRAVVASRCGGIPEVVTDGETGLLVPPEDPIALSQAIARLMGDLQLASRLGAAGRVRARAEFSAERMAERTVALYEELLG